MNGMAYKSKKVEDDFDVNVDFETGFVGRENELNELHKAWERHRIFGIFGLRSVGKSRLVKEFFKRYKSEDATVTQIDMKTLPDTVSLYAIICASLGLQINQQSEESEILIHQIVRFICSTTERHFIFFFDNAEEFQDIRGESSRDSFSTLCSSLIRQCKHVTVFISSTSRLPLAHLGEVYYSYEVLPLKQTETRQLLKNVTAGIELGEYVDTLANLSEGLPLLILMIGSELTEDGGLITPKDMVEFLLTCRLRALSRDFYPEEDRVADVYQKFLDRLDDVYKKSLAVLVYIPGTFNADQAKQMLDFNTDVSVKEQTLMPIRRRHVLNYDQNTDRYSIQGILRECISTFYIIKNIPEIREKYIKTFSTVMANISKRLDTTEYATALAEFTAEQPNLKKLLLDVQYTTHDNYRFFIEMATTCTGMIEHFMSGNGEIFYQQCLKAADMYGQDNDRASVHIAVGSLYTNTTGYLLRGQEHYTTALSILDYQEKSLLLATAYQRLGWNIHLQGMNTEALPYFEKSLAISLVSGGKFQLIAVNSLSSMGVSLTFLGEFEEAGKYHFHSLKRRRMFLGENHPAVGACYDNIGDLYYLKGDSKEGLEYYRKGLELKMKSKAPVLSTVISLCNTAKMRLSVGNSKEARSLLDQGFKKLDEEDLPPREAIARACDTKGMVFMSEGLLHDAEKMFRKAVDLRKDISPNHISCPESLAHLAKINEMQGNMTSSLELAEEGLKLGENAVVSVPQTFVIVDNLECIESICTKQGDTQRQIETLENLREELLRLERLFLSQQNDRDLNVVRQKLRQLEDKLRNM